MRILYCLNHFLPQSMGGTEMYVWALCKYLQNDKVDFAVLHPRFNEDIPAEYLYDGIPVVTYLETTIAGHDAFLGKKAPSGIQEFKKIIHKIQPDIIHFHEITPSNGITIHHVKAAINKGIKTILTCHLAHYSCSAGTLIQNGKVLCNGVWGLKKCTKCVYHFRIKTSLLSSILSHLSLLYQTLRISSIVPIQKLRSALNISYYVKRTKEDLTTLADNVDQIVVLAQWYKNILLANGVPLQKITIIEQGLISNSFEKDTKLDTSITPPVKLVFIGRIDPVKGLQLIIDAFKCFSADEITIDLFGNVPDKEYENKFLTQINQISGITYRGKIANEEVVSTLQQYDALLLPSMFSEMAPLVIQEAFKANVPVIGSNVYGISEFVEHEKNGLLFEFSNLKHLTEILQNIVVKPETLKKLKQKIKEPYSFKKVAEQYHELYHSVLASA